jgi:hypothetical protein
VQPAPPESVALGLQRALALSPFVINSQDGVVLSPASAAALSPASPTIRPPSYRAALPPRLHFRLFSFGRDLAGDRRAAGEAEAEASERRSSVGTGGAAHGQPHITSRTVLSAESTLTFGERLRYAGVLLHPQGALKDRHLYALLVFFLLPLPLLAGVFALSALLSCSNGGASLLAPVCAGWTGLSGVVLAALYVGEFGPFDCAMKPLRETVPAQRNNQHGAAVQQSAEKREHRWLPARSPVLMCFALGLLFLQALVLALLAGQQFKALCRLNERVSVNDAASFSSYMQHYNGAPAAAGGLAGPVTDDGTLHLDCTSTRSTLRFRDGFVDTRLVRAVNVSDVADGSGGGSSVVALDPSSTVLPTRMVLLSPVWASEVDPLYARIVPAWVAGSFDWHLGRSDNDEGDAAVRRDIGRAKLVKDWSSPYRFGRTINKLDRDYAVMQSLVEETLTARGMTQLSGAPMLYWTDPAPQLASATWRAWMLVSVSAVLSVLVWGGTAYAHVQWYRSMLAEEAAWEAATTRRSAARTMHVRAGSPRREEEDEDEARAQRRKHEEADSVERKSAPESRSGRNGEEVELGAFASSSAASRPATASSAASFSHGELASPSKVRASALSTGPLSSPSRSSTAFAFSPGGAEAAATSSRPSTASHSSWWTRTFGGSASVAVASEVNPVEELKRTQTGSAATSPRSPSKAFAEAALSSPERPRQGAAASLSPLSPAAVASRPGSGRNATAVASPSSRPSSGRSALSLLPPSSSSQQQQELLAQQIPSPTRVVLHMGGDDVGGAQQAPGNSGSTIAVSRPLQPQSSHVPASSSVRRQSPRGSPRSSPRDSPRHFDPFAARRASAAPNAVTSAVPQLPTPVELSSGGPVALASAATAVDADDAKSEADGMMPTEAEIAVAEDEAGGHIYEFGTRSEQIAQQRAARASAAATPPMGLSNRSPRGRTSATD